MSRNGQGGHGRDEVQESLGFERNYTGNTVHGLTSRLTSLLGRA